MSEQDLKNYSMLTLLQEPVYEQLSNRFNTVKTSPSQNVEVMLNC